MNRRNFLKQTGVTTGLTAVRGLHGATQNVSIIVDPHDPIASAAPPAWAIRELQAALTAQSVSSKVYPQIQDAPASDRHIIVAGANSMAAREILRGAKSEMSSSAESLCLVPGSLSGKPALLAGGSDPRGLVYAVLELADRVKYGIAPAAALEIKTPIVEKPANAIRSCARCFVTPIEDKAWFYDREMWTDYLSNLAAHRFNRFNLTLAQSPYPLLYYFEVHEDGGSAIYPGFSPDLSNQPYYLVRSNRLRG